MVRAVRKAESARRHCHGMPVLADAGHRAGQFRYVVNGYRQPPAGYRDRATVRWGRRPARTSSRP